MNLDPSVVQHARWQSRGQRFDSRQHRILQKKIQI